jgi:hypothetical protein
MATLTSPATVGASKLGDVYTAVETLKSLGADLFSAYESDDAAYSIAGRAGDIVRQASQLEDLFNNIGAALQNLGS